MLKKIALLRDRVANWETYPFSIPVLRSLDSLVLRKRVCFFVGENGSGKSTLLEAIAAHYGFGREGGTRNFVSESTASLHAVDPLVRALRLSFDRRTGMGFFLRAESFFNVATYVDQIGGQGAYGGVSLHEQSHGESFLAALVHRCDDNGLFLMDEPEAALSPQRQLSLLVFLHDALRKRPDAQFIIATHSPLLLGLPDAQIVSFDGDHLQEITYEQSAPREIVRRFVNDREAFLEELFAHKDDQQTLFGES